MKKILALMVAFAVGMFSIGCGGSSSTTPKGSPATGSTGTAPTMPKDDKGDKKDGK